MVAHFLMVFLFAALVSSDCPPNTIYESLFGKCYKYVNQPTSFLAAEQNCNSIGGNLVALRNAFEGSYVSGIAAEGGSSGTYWIGANFLLSSQWSWTSNTSMSYTNWASGQPIDPSIYQCGAVRSVDNTWIKELCNSIHSYICTVDPNASTPQGICPTVPTVSPTSWSGVCDNGYTYFSGDNKCYKVRNLCSTNRELQYYSTFQNYDEAVKSCYLDNAVLPKIVSQNQNDFLVRLSDASDSRVYHCGGYCPRIGLRCTGNSTSTCSWTDGSLLTGYNNLDLNWFESSRPNSSFYLAVPDQGIWAHQDYYDEVSFLCQKNASPLFTEEKARNENVQLHLVGKQIRSRYSNKPMLTSSP